MLPFTPDVINTLITLEIDISALKMLNATARLDRYSGNQMVTFGEYMNDDTLITVVQDNYKHTLYFDEQVANLYVNTYDYDFVDVPKEETFEDMDFVVIE